VAPTILDPSGATTVVLDGICTRMRDCCAVAEAFRASSSGPLGTFVLPTRPGRTPRGTPRGCNHCARSRARQRLVVVVDVRVDGAATMMIRGGCQRSAPARSRAGCGSARCRRSRRRPRPRRRARREGRPAVVRSERLAASFSACRTDTGRPPPCAADSAAMAPDTTTAHAASANNFRSSASFGRRDQSRAPGLVRDLLQPVAQVVKPSGKTNSVTPA